MIAPQSAQAQSPTTSTSPRPVSATQEISQATDQSDEASPSASPNVVREELNKRIQKKLEEGRDKVAGALDSFLSEKRAIIGEVQRITDEALTIQHQDGTTIIPLSDQVTLLKNNKAIASSEIAVGNWATVLGNRERSTVEPEYVLISVESLLPKQQIVLLGTVTKQARNSLTIQPRGGEAPKTIRITRSTAIQSSNGDEATITDLSTDITVLVAGFISEDGIDASTIRSLAELK